MRQFACLFQPIWLLQPAYTDSAGVVLCSFLHLVTATGRGEIGRVDRWRKENFLVEFHQMSRHQTRDKYLVWGPTDAVPHAVSSNFFGDASQELSFWRILPSCGSDQVLLKVQQMEMKAWLLVVCFFFFCRCCQVCRHFRLSLLFWKILHTFRTILIYLNDIQASFNGNVKVTTCILYSGKLLYLIFVLFLLQDEFPMLLHSPSLNVSFFSMRHLSHQYAYIFIFFSQTSKDSKIKGNIC